ncbi:MAG: patatin-like phospholipase family protein [Acidobacteriota bacterium]|nr:patatin-like phospholipase family protein [Acidobacteriota bacterium]
MKRPQPGTKAGPVPVTNTPKLGVALGGGFARGLVHVGILKVLEEEHIPISFIGGTSVGAVIAAAYSSGVSAKELEEIAHLVRFNSFARWTLSRYGLASNDRMVPFLEKLVKVKTFEECRIPLAISATDFVTGDPVVFTSGSLIDPIRASCAYPGMFLPVNANGRLMVDGLLAHSVPAEPLKQMGADKVLSVYLSAHWVNVKGPRHIFDVIGQCFSIAQAKMCHLWKVHSDLVLEPNVDGFSYDGFERAKELIKVGEDAAREAAPQMHAWFENAEKSEKAQESGATQIVTTAAPVSSSKGGAPARSPAPLLAK